MTGLMIAERLSSLVEVVVECSHFGMFFENVVDHCFDFMGQKHPQFLTDNLDAQGVDRTNDRLVLVLEGLQSGLDVVLELSGNDPVEGDDEDVAAVSGQAFWVEDALNSAYKAECLTASRPSDAADRIAVRVDKEWHLGPENALVP